MYEDLPGFWAVHLTDPSAWPVFFVDLGNSSRLAVVYRNFDEDEGQDYLLIPGSAQASIKIATLEGGPEGAGLWWPELKGIADRQPTEIERARTLLLLAPILGDTDSGEAASTAAVKPADLHTVTRELGR
jgi:hypothetical protein